MDFWLRTCFYFIVKSSYDQIWEAALKRLETRMHSKRELAQKLLDKFPEERGTVLKVLEELERVQLLNDRRFTEEFVLHLIRKPIGRLKIMSETLKRGLSDTAVEQVLLDAEWNEEEAAKQALEEKKRLLREEDDRKKKEKIVNFLKNRGFKDATIFRVLK